MKMFWGNSDRKSRKNQPLSLYNPAFKKHGSSNTTPPKHESTKIGSPSSSSLLPSPSMQGKSPSVLEPILYHDIPTGITKRGENNEHRDNTTVDYVNSNSNNSNNNKNTVTIGKDTAKENNPLQENCDTMISIKNSIAALLTALWEYLFKFLLKNLNNNNNKNSNSNQQTPTPTQTQRRLGITLICISDTHGEHHKLKMPKQTLHDIQNNTILIHAGDYTKYGNKDHLIDFNNWLKSLPPYKCKIVVNGNHECNASWKMFVKSYLDEAVVLIDESIDVNFHIDNCDEKNGKERDDNSSCQGDGTCSDDNQQNRNDYNQEENTTLEQSQSQKHTIKIHGTNFYWPCHDLHNPYYDSIHPSTDILITHCPVQSYVDNDNRGCPTLLHLLKKEQKIQPQIVICGHEHLGSGVVTDNELGITFVNAANAKGGSRGGHSVGKQPIVLTL